MIRRILLTSLALFVSPFLNAMECEHETTDEFWKAAEKVYIGTVMLGRYDGSTIYYEIKISRLLKGKAGNTHQLTGNFGAFNPLPIAARVIVFESEGTIMPCSPSGKINLELAHTKRADIHPEKIKFTKEILRLIANDS